MKIKQKFIQLLIRALCGSVDGHTIISFGRRVMPDYDFYRSMGLSDSLSIPKRDIAKHLIDELIEKEYILDFVALMITATHEGLNGKVYRFPDLNLIIKEINDEGLLYDSSLGMFIEDSQIRRTKNWGVLKENGSYIFTFLRIDIVGNTVMVRKYEPEKIKKVFKIILDELQEIAEEKEGRIWHWAGDGGVISFFSRNRNERAVLSAMEILHRMFTFNHFMNPLDEPVQLRMAVSSGQCFFSMDEQKILHNESIKKIMALEASYTQPDSITITDEVLLHLDPLLGAKFLKKERKNGSSLHNYSLRWSEE